MFLKKIFGSRLISSSQSDMADFEPICKKHGRASKSSKFKRKSKKLKHLIQSYSIHIQTIYNSFNFIPFLSISIQFLSIFH